MSDSPSKGQKKAMLRAVKEQQRAAAEAALPLPRPALAALFDHLDAALEDAGACDHSFRLATGFLDARELDTIRVLAWLRDSGAFCDCEALNLEDRWSDHVQVD